MTIRFGIAGFRHPHVSMLIEELGRRTDVTLVAIAEEDDVIRDHYANLLGVPAYSDHRELFALERLDAVGVVPIPGNRANVIVAALEAGLHVLSDKPLCTAIDDLERIEVAWRERGRMLSMLLEKRFHPTIIAAKALIESGKLGEIAMVSASAPHKLRRATRPAWMWSRAEYGGIINDLCIHDIDLVLWLTGLASGSVHGSTSNVAHEELPEFEDIGQCYLRGSGGLLATLDAHWLSPDAAPAGGDYRMVLTGTKGVAEVRFASNELLVATNHGHIESIDLPAAASTVAGDFFDAIIGGKPGVIRAEEVFLATRIALLAQRSATTGGWSPWTAM